VAERPADTDGASLAKLAAMRTSSTMPAIAAFAALLWISSCAAGSSDSTAASNSAAGSNITTNTAGSAPVTGNIDPGLQPYIDIAVSDLAQRLSADAAGITVTSATLVVWPDSSLGCPAPGQEYAQVTTDGALILLQAAGTEYPYHAGGSREPFLCEKPGKSLTGTISTDL